jgi:hypothetical protein
VPALAPLRLLLGCGWWGLFFFTSVSVAPPILQITFPFCFLRHQADFARGFCYPNLDGLIPLVSMFCCFVVHAFRLLPLVFFLMMFDLRCAYCFRKSLATLPALFSNSWRGSLFYTLLSFDRSLFPLFFDPTLSYLRSVLALSKLS